MRFDARPITTTFSWSGGPAQRASVSKRLHRDGSVAVDACRTAEHDTSQPHARVCLSICHVAVKIPSSPILARLALALLATTARPDDMILPNASKN